MQRRRFNGRERVALYLASGGKCAMCGVHLSPGWHADHRQAYVHGGVTDVVNGQALCPTCNLKKGSKGEGMVKPLRTWQQEALQLYDLHMEENFLLEATPGAGKTRFSGEVGKRLLDRHEVRALLVIVPTSRLRKQTADAFSELGIQIDPRWSGTTSLINGKFCGAVVTYQWVAGNATLLRAQVSWQNTLAILDEVHHAGEAEHLTWGKALREALQPAYRRLLTTGTPFRTDLNEIPFVGYVHFERGNVAVPDYRINYGEALRQEPPIVRSVFFPRHGGTMEWEDEDGHVLATFEDELDDRGQSRRLRTALDANGGHMGGLLHDAHRKLMELREHDPDAGGLIIAMDTKHAQAIVKRLRQEFGIHAVIATSKNESFDEPEPHAEAVIEAFAKSDKPWLVTVKMVSEGVDIPRLRVCVFASNVVTELFFIQAVGRVVRVESSHDDHSAYFYIPDDPRLRTFAKQIRDARDIALREKKRRDRVEELIEEAEEAIAPPFFNPVRSTSEEAGVIIDDQFLTPAELAFADEQRRKLPPNLGVTREAAAYLYRLAKVIIPAEYTAHTTHTTAQHDQPEYVAIEHLRASNKAIVGRLNERYGLEFDVIQRKLNASVGIASVTTCGDSDKLRQRLDNARRWLKGEIQL